MTRHCERPACSGPAAVAYVIDPSKLLVRIDSPIPGDSSRMNVLCRRHADSLVVPKGWTIDDNREKKQRLFSSPATTVLTDDTALSRRGGRQKSAQVSPELFDPQETKALPWTPQFDRDGDLGGTLRASGRLLGRAFGNHDPDHDQSHPED